MTGTSAARDPRGVRRREREARLRARRRRTAVGALAAVALLVVVAIAIAGGGSSAPPGSGRPLAARAVHGAPAGHGARSAGGTSRGTGVPGSARVPILMYHVINPPPAGALFPGLYVPAAEFAGQMQALKAAGWHAVTMDQVWAYWRRGVPLGPGRPIVVSFDNGYISQYSNALPVMRRLGWVGVENIQLSGLPPSQGGLDDAQIRALLSAGWELDTQGYDHADLIKLGPGALRFQILTTRETLRRRYGVPVNWFCYPSGHYDATVVSAVRDAGYVGSTTVVPGWADPHGDMYRLPRLRVLGGTTPAGLLAQIARYRASSSVPAAYGGA